MTLHGYVDSTWAGNAVDKKSTFRFCFSIGSTMISWSSWKEGSVALSTLEVEYIASNDANWEVVWLRNLLVGLFGEVLEMTIIYCDN